MPKKAGKGYPFDDDSILEVNSPKPLIDGPYVVVYKDETERWAIIAFDYEGAPNLGIRWFWENSGFPNSRGFGTWLVLSPNLTQGLLSGLTVPLERLEAVRDFLSKKITGAALKQKFR